MDQYTEAHLFVAAIRVLEHQQKRPPSVEETCTLIALSPEAGYALCRKLTKRGIVRMVEGAFGVKLFIENHCNLEKIPKGEQKKDLARELADFQKKQQGKNRKVEAVQEELAKKRKAAFAELEAQLKKEIKKE